MKVKSKKAATKQIKNLEKINIYTIILFKILRGVMMKDGIHPAAKEVVFTCACGNEIKTLSTAKRQV